MLTKIIIGFNVLLLLAACNQSGLSSDAKKIYENRNDLIQKFDGVSVFRRGDSTFSLFVYNDGKENRYLFRGNNGLHLDGDTIEFQLSERFKNIDTVNQSNGAKNLLEVLLKEMSSINANDVSSDFKHLGINLMIYICGGGVVFFVKDLSSVINVEWQKYIKGSKMIDEHWYYNEK